MPREGQFGPVWVVWGVGSSGQDVSGDPNFFASFMSRVNKIIEQNKNSGRGAISAGSRRDLVAEIA